MKASIISIGNEILSGQTVDTNAAYLSRKLLSVGIGVASCYTVGDGVEAIERALRQAGEDGDIILVTGGLGPTDDDVTRQGIAEFLGVELRLDEEQLRKIEMYFSSRGRKMAEKNKIQAYIPEGARGLDNNLGTAPGIMAGAGGKVYAAMPGVPAEMKQMFEESVFGELSKVGEGEVIFVRKLMCFGTGESNIAEMLGDLMERERNPLINCTVTRGVITLHIIASAKDRRTAKETAEKDEAVLRKLLGELVYGVDGQTLSEVVGRKLAEQGKTIAIAESCTGGLIAKLLTDTAGSSRYFTCGWVTYSNDAKISELGVEADLIAQHGAVSGEVAEAMAKCAKKKSGADFGIGVTGIAGPGGATADKPVGLVHISLDCEEGVKTKKFMWSHNREFVRDITAQTALNIVRLKL